MSFALENRLFHVKHFYGVVVIGGGHAGCEASLASSRMGCSTLLVTMDQNKIAEMSCNPSIGGVGKGQLVKEVDALGGEMGKIADCTGIQFKRLNTRKGSAVQSSRCQSDKKKYAARMQEVISSQASLEVLEGEVKELLAEEGRIRGLTVKKRDGSTIEIGATTIVVTTGTFMQGVMHCGTNISDGGRFGEKSSFGLSDCLRNLGFALLRLKTGTPPRLIRDSIDFTGMQTQLGDNPPQRFSFSDTRIELPQVNCYLTYTGDQTHQVILRNLEKSPLYSGQIKGIGPRYCPSIEDKVVKFPQKTRHQIFMEPESLDSDWIYPNGISTSLPPEVQEEFVRSIVGCEKVKFARYGYAVEYDCIDPKQLRPTLEATHLSGLFLAGQVNGTSGYEEAAAQGIMAGINAALKCKKEAPFVLARSESYIGVMVDDLITVGVTEPYRMFTSRAEFRLSLREDNADLRLRPYGHRLGLVNENDFHRFQSREYRIRQIKSSLPLNISQLLKRPEVTLEDVLSLMNQDMRSLITDDIVETLEVEVKYEGYIELQRQEIARLSKMQNLSIPERLDFSEVSGLSFEIREKLHRIRPKTLGDASKISGVTPAALTALLFHLRRKGTFSAESQRGF